MRLVQHGGRGPAALFAARVRNHAVGAELVAALDDGDVSAMRIGARGKLRLEGLVGLAVVEPGNALLPSLQPRQHLRQIAIGRGPATSETYGAFSKIFSPSCCATQPSTANFLPSPCSFLYSFSR